MNRIKHGKLLILFGLILMLNSIFFTYTYAQHLSMAPAKENVHPKMESFLKKLEGEYEKGTTAARLFAQSRNINIDHQDKTTVYLMSEPGTTIDEMLLQALGAEIIKRANNVFKVKAPINMLTTIADTVNGVSFIKTPDKLIPSAVQSEGVDLTDASSYHTAGYTGSGVNIAIIDVGFAQLNNTISNGDLPNSVVKIDCTGSGCVSSGFSSETERHGTAVAEIVYDMAPGATLYLIKVSDTLDLWDAKDYAVSNGIKIINHSLVVFNSNFYAGECYSSNAVCSADAAYANGILWVNAAGNQADRHYQATFSDTDSIPNGFHNVSSTDETININANANDTITVYLTWEAWPTTDQDYDLYLLDSSLDPNNPVASSTTLQSGTPPVETINVQVSSSGTYHIAIHQDSATSNHRLEIYSLYHNLSPTVASSSLVSPADADGALAVGAINYSNWTSGPQESFSSQGPTNDGRVKPNISGPDNVLTFVYNGRFAGTSAATPHVVGAAALILDENSGYSVSQLWNALIAAAIDMGICGNDNIYGYGRLNLGEGGGFTCASTESSDGSSSSGGGGCFIATAAYGSPMATHVKVLREMRDRFLLTNSAGKTFVNFYYTHSPVVATYITGHAGLRTIVRFGLLPVVGVSWIALKIGLVPTMGFMLLFGVCLVGFARSRNFISRKKS